jgi:hypothetical protein
MAKPSVEVLSGRLPAAVKFVVSRALRRQWGARSRQHEHLNGVGKPSKMSSSLLMFQLWAQKHQEEVAVTSARMRLFARHMPTAMP